MMQCPVAWHQPCSPICQLLGLVTHDLCQRLGFSTFNLSPTFIVETKRRKAEWKHWVDTFDTLSTGTPEDLA